MSDSTQDGSTLSREDLVEEFGEEHVQHTEWWSEEMSRIDEVRDEIVSTVLGRDDVQLAKRGSHAERSGKHRASFEIVVAGEPWEGVDDGE